ncbi:MAG TPA: DUF3048 domain-containing protein [Dissulfurispiraceae bacterium]|nr:DUF3048 domain-containing protein [Dissulfurispiraceae bacterium]
MIISMDRLRLPDTPWFGLSGALVLLLFLNACTTGGEFIPAGLTEQPALESVEMRLTEIYTAQATAEAGQKSAPVTRQDAAINPLTGLVAPQPELLNRRPVIVKVQNLPRPRLQWGVAEADLVYEYFTELGSTRFAAIFYGNSPSKVAPIRSARWIDFHLVRMYNSVFVFGSAYYELLDALFAAEFSERALIEYPGTCPAICRRESNGKNYLAADLTALDDFLLREGIENSRPDLSGMHFDQVIPEGGNSAQLVYAKFSADVYSRWDYDPGSGRYLRFSDTQNARTPSGEQYEALLDQSSGEQIAVENVVMILAEYELLVQTETSEVFDVALFGSGMAYLARDGRLYNVRWVRPDTNSPLKLVGQKGVDFPFKPGKTWFEVMGLHTDITRAGDTWRFHHRMP